jgi:hypothetical protein
MFVNDGWIMTRVHTQKTASDTSMDPVSYEIILVKMIAPKKYCDYQDYE